jgi:hypothetical protein
MKIFEIDVNENIKDNQFARFKWKLSTKSILETLGMDILELIRNTKDRKVAILKEVNDHDLVSALNYYLSNSVFKRLLKKFIDNVISDASTIFDNTIGFYVTFERVDNSPVAAMSAELGSSLIDSAVGISTFKIRREGKMGVITVPYQLLVKSFDGLSGFKPKHSSTIDGEQIAKDYFIRTVGSHNIFTQMY